MKNESYTPLPFGLIIADSMINGQGVFTTRKLVQGTLLGISHYRIGKTYIRTPLGGFMNHSEEPNCHRAQARIREGFDKWYVTVVEDLEEGEELTLKYILYNPKKDE